MRPHVMDLAPAIGDNNRPQDTKVGLPLRLVGGQMAR